MSKPQDLVTRSPRETFLVSRILKDLRDRGHYAYKNHGAAYSLLGLPDIVACVHGYFVGMEVKRDSKSHASEAQKKNLRQIGEAQGFARVVDSWESYEKFMKHIEKEAFG